MNIHDVHVSKATKEKSFLIFCSSLMAAIISIVTVWSLLDASVLTEAEHRIDSHPIIHELIIKGDLI